MKTQLSQKGSSQTAETSVDRELSELQSKTKKAANGKELETSVDQELKELQSKTKKNK